MSSPAKGIEPPWQKPGEPLIIWEEGNKLSDPPPPDPVEEALPPHPPIAFGGMAPQGEEFIPPQRAKRTRGEGPSAPDEPQFIQGGETQSGGGLMPPFRPPSPNQTFADGLILRGQEEAPDPNPLRPLLQMPANVVLADEDYPTAEWPGISPETAEMPEICTETVKMPESRPEIAKLPKVCPDDSVSQAGRKLTTRHHDLDLEDYRQDHGTRMSN